MSDTGTPCSVQMIDLKREDSCTRKLLEDAEKADKSFVSALAFSLRQRRFPLCLSLRLK